MSETTSLPAARTYHCICTTLVLTTLHELALLATRKNVGDSAVILPLSGTGADSSRSTTSILHNLTTEKRPVIVRRDDGLEKRILLRCQRCDLVVAYKLDEAHFNGSRMQADELCYILPGSLQSTEEMASGKAPESPKWAQKV